MLNRYLATAAIALGAAVAVPAAANAYTAYTTGSVNQRVGPGVGYSRMGSLPAGAAVDVHFCQVGWCEVGSYLGIGWVASGYLSNGMRVFPQPYPPLFVQPYPYPYPRIYRPSPFFQFYIGPRRRWW